MRISALDRIASHTECAADAISGAARVLAGIPDTAEPNLDHFEDLELVKYTLNAEMNTLREYANEIENHIMPRVLNAKYDVMIELGKKGTTSTER